ncbi:hypothetical protein M9H77_11994 [Catharanthus roseus]|uniref:Uncharacterized protein n=1 Tax=Catharanthus roseus TaxID=4058 RepID=A0ACC0BG33_CATRO|nr:hypothetical protein M9H77_11994 [Catharanthus roseus]
MELTSPLRVKNCQWKWCSNAIPSHEKLLRKHVIKHSVAALCSKCSSLIETDFHILFSCNLVRNVWKILNLDLAWAWRNATSHVVLWSSLVSHQDNFPPDFVAGPWFGGNYGVLGMDDSQVVFHKACLSAPNFSLAGDSVKINDFPNQLYRIVHLEMLVNSDSQAVFRKPCLSAPNFSQAGNFIQSIWTSLGSSNSSNPPDPLKFNTPLICLSSALLHAQQRPQDFDSSSLSHFSVST